jgi:acetyltransferase-like isoleucine patch superfamily enzyme
VKEHGPIPRRSHGTGQWTIEEFASFGEGSFIEADVLVFHPDHVAVGRGVYVGHLAILKGYHRNRLVIGDGTWIGEQSFLHAAGGITIGRNVGIGPGVKIISSRHAEAGPDTPILNSPIELAPVAIGDDADLGIGSIVLPGVTIGRGVQVGAGAVVSRDLPDFSVAAGVPARVMRMRPSGEGQARS